MDATAPNRNVDLVEPNHRFLPAPPKSPYRHPPTADSLTVPPAEYGTSVRIMGGPQLGSERYLRSLLGEHRSKVSVRLPPPARCIRAGQTGV